MPHIKKIVMKGFKSFAKETEIPFDSGLNVVIGPNGSGKSNISDAICFVLGRLSIKSMRAAKAANLIYNGGKENKPSFEARIDMHIDNSDKTFPTEGNVIISRVVRRNGLSIYKINDETKTRQEVIDMLMHGNIDPYGFNIILQGEISRFVEMHSEERRKIIEDVAGISVYELRKSQSLRELDKTEQRISEVNTILHERFSFMKNLEKERGEALKYKDLELTVKKCKASILKKDMNEKEKEIQAIDKAITSVDSVANRLKKQIETENKEIKEIQDRITVINEKIQRSGGQDQQTLSSEISELKVQIGSLTARKENFENQIRETRRRNEELLKNIEEEEKNIEERKKGIKTYSDKELREKKKALEEIEEKRKKFYSMRTELESLTERVSEKRKSMQKLKNEAEFTFNQISQLSINLSVFELGGAKALQHEFNGKIQSFIEKENSFQHSILEIEKEIAANHGKIDNFRKIRGNIEKLDICPVCNTKITKEHTHKVVEEMNEKIEEINSDTSDKEDRRKNIKEELHEIQAESNELRKKLEKTTADLRILENVEEKNKHNVKLRKDEEILISEIEILERRKSNLEKSIDEYSGIEERYDSLNLDVSELMRREEKNLGTELSFKQRDLEKTSLIIKTNQREIEETLKKIQAIEEDVQDKAQILERREKKEKEQQEKFQKAFNDREGLQNNTIERNKKVLEVRAEISNNENKINNFKVSRAQLSTQYEMIAAEFSNYREIELLQGSKEVLTERLQRTEESLQRLGNVNMRALEVYESVKGEYDTVAVKSEQLKKEKEEIMKIIAEIDRKKRITFMKTLTAINDLFTENFARLCDKGEAFLELENKENPFEAGLDILLKQGKGKYFDANSLSGGEQTLVALALILAIQKYRPYCFYILDEIDAALDKRNSERLASLLKDNIQAAQYLVITHNDALISSATTIYGVSMQEGISKILSLKL